MMQRRSLLTIFPPSKEKPKQLPSYLGITTNVEIMFIRPNNWRDELWDKWLLGLNRIYKSGKFKVSINKSG